MLDFVINIFSHPIFPIAGGIATLTVVSAAIYTSYLVARGVLPVLYRLGISLSKRKIAILAEADEFNNLKNVLIDSKLFRCKNITRIDKNSIQRAEGKSLLLVHWRSCEDCLDSILDIKKDTTVLIIYAPSDEGPIENEVMTKIGKHRNTTVVNFRGRLLSDMLVSMMTSRES